LADHVEMLPDSDPNLIILERIQGRHALERYSPGEDARQMIGTFGFHFPEGAFDQFLSDLSAAEVREVNQQREASLREGMRVGEPFMPDDG
jgi:hypothetical protein